MKAVFRTFRRSCDGYVLPETNTVTADRAAAEAADRLGGGNISAGIRRALAALPAEKPA